MKKLQKVGGFALALLMAITVAVPATNASAQTTSTACGPYVRDLTLGSTGADVVLLQTFLEAKGFLVIPTGVAKGYFGTLTRAALGRYQAANAISPTAGYFGPLTRAKLAVECASNPTTPTNPGNNNGGLEGGDGDIQDISQTNSGTETTLGEGDTEDVLGFDLEADDNSDLEISSIRVRITAGADGSNRLNRYLDEVAISLDGEEVGSVDASDFSRSGDVHTATISLDDAIVRMGDEGRFYVTLTAADSINDSDLDNTLVVEVDRVRVEDASGAILTEDVDDVEATVDFEDSSANDDARVKISSDTRDAGLLKIDENSTSDEYDVLSFEFDVDDDSSSLLVTELEVELEIDNASTTAALDVEKLVQDMFVEVDGESYDDYEISDTSVAAGATETVTVTFTIDEGDLEIAEGDTVDGVVFIKFGRQDGNYAQGTTIQAVVRGSGITAENDDGDDFEVSGTATGKVQTLQISAAEIGNFRWSVNNTGTIIDFFFTVEAEDEDFTVLAASIQDTVSGTASTSAGVLSLSSGDAQAVSGGYEVVDGDSATFRIRYTLSGANGTYGEVRITSVAGQEVPNGEQVSPTATINVN